MWYQFSKILHFLSRVIKTSPGITFHLSALFLPAQAFHPHYFICAATRYHSKISAGTWSFQLRVYYRVCFRSWNSKPLARWEKFRFDRSPTRWYILYQPSKTKRACIRTRLWVCKVAFPRILLHGQDRNFHFLFLRGKHGKQGKEINIHITKRHMLLSRKKKKT